MVARQQAYHPQAPELLRSAEKIHVPLSSISLAPFQPMIPQPALRTTAAALRQLSLWFLLVAPVGVLAGSASAFFLFLLEWVTVKRFDHPWLLWLLPMAGIVIVWVYHAAGKNADRGTNLLIDEIHQPGGGVPARITPLVLGATLVTHLFGGSAGREGTAVQMGGGIASAFARVFRIPMQHRSLLLMAGVAAGFGSVFGTPLAGAIFALEVLTVGRIRYEFILPCLLASFIGDCTCAAWGILHPVYTLMPSLPASAFMIGHLDIAVMSKVAVAGAVFGLCARLFSITTHGVSAWSKHYIPVFWLRPAVGAALIIAMTYALGTREFLGLGSWSPDNNDVTLSSVFRAGGAGHWSWFWKLAFTAITLGFGFKGGEVTPLFFIGAALGNVMAGPLGLPVDLTAGLGFIAIFAGASNTPLACTLMGIELFGATHAPLFAVACFFSYYFSGHAGIYTAQRHGLQKHLTT
jgi:H+/Cl- antiporter ClcA